MWLDNPEGKKIFSEQKKQCLTMFFFFLDFKSPWSYYYTTKSPAVAVGRTIWPGAWSFLHWNIKNLRSDGVNAQTAAWHLERAAGKAPSSSGLEWVALPGRWLPGKWGWQLPRGHQSISWCLTLDTASRFLPPALLRQFWEHLPRFLRCRLFKP